ncbi:Prostaglandin F synthase 1 [Wickerhamomyces ciferrii]|uniref:Prostaglandin F synthase 1 n=1 Tax=Wickerhamomyces ciferrii (strain ATCC 14091 / BCRC 22168 / CBS 111 / JCM 3599 / NBRC 0793 / NRRL Y-1031 F-60-10) TaxID=1206466 RepID=K0KPP0_WICCF|nr:Prostaglandin F synthase 1 [Wickerhamomyces ciferrii]CCH43354.1 Prostaglandin F synthase 1 [Wickerhamomyces ciferrii]
MSLQKDSWLPLNNGLKIPVSGFGLYQIPVEDSTKLTYEALKAGYRHIDSAQAYQNEEEGAKGISQFLKENSDIKRSDIFFTTKIKNGEHGYEESKKSIEKSLAKVSPYIDYIDLFLVHSPISSKEQRLGTWKALQEAVESGKVKSIGVSNFGTPHLDELYAWEGLKNKPVVNQLELHPWLPRKDLQAYGKKYDYLLEAYSPLTQAKKLDDPELVSIAKKHNVTPAQILLRWSYDQGFIPLAKTVNVDRIKENFNVLDNVPKLSDEDYKILDKDSYEVLTWDPTKHVDQ